MMPESVHGVMRRDKQQRSVLGIAAKILRLSCVWAISLHLDTTTAKEVNRIYQTYGGSASSLIEFELRRTGMLTIISAPSGGGKSTLLRALLAAEPSLYYSISATTRTRRAPETHGKDYFFYSEDEFSHLRDNKGFYEWAVVHGNLYGTLKSEVDSKLSQGRDVIMDIDVNGSMRMKKEVPDCTTIFILPPSMVTLEKRLRERGTDDEATIQRRLTNAREEVRAAFRYDYILVNQDLDKTVQSMRNIITAQRFRASRTMIQDSKGSVLAPATQGV
ncbi:MAG: guanylate kinase [Candidatus Sumerlaeota bacterium]